MLFADLLVEFIGTFFLVAIIIATSGQAVAAGVALAGAIFLAGQNNAAHFNPAVSVALYLKGDITLKRFLTMILGQIIAAAAAMLFVRWMPIKPTSKPK